MNFLKMYELKDLCIGKNVKFSYSKLSKTQDCLNSATHVNKNKILLSGRRCLILKKRLIKTCMRLGSVTQDIACGIRNFFLPGEN